MTNLEFLHCVAVEGLVSDSLAVFEGDIVDKPESQRADPGPSEVRDGIEESHVGASNSRVTHFSMERHRWNKHGVCEHLDSREKNKKHKEREYKINRSGENHSL